MNQQAILNELQLVLADLYLRDEEADRIAVASGIDLRFVTHSSRPINYWGNILRAAINSDRFEKVLEVAISEYRANGELCAAVNKYQSFVNAGGRFDKQATDERLTRWNGESSGSYGNLESASTYRERGFSVATNWLLEDIDKLSNRLSAETEQRLKEMRNAWREGRKADASNWLSDLRNDSRSWMALSAEIQANLLCFEASLVLDSGDINHAKQLVDKAMILASIDSEARVRALITLYENGPTPALELLLEYNDIDSVNLRAALTLEQGQPDRCLTLLNEPRIIQLSNAETFRVRALASLMAKNLAQAQLEIQKAVELNPHWESVREALALINYYSSVSASIIPERPIALPEPVGPIFIKSDNESRARLRQAAQSFHELGDNTEKSAAARARLHIWEMACLANDPEQQESARTCCRQILQAHPTEYAAIAWATARGYEVDLQASCIALEQRHQEVSTDLQAVLGLVLCYFQLKRYTEAVHILEASRDLFEDSQTISIWTHWYVRALIAGDKQDNIDQIIESLRNGPYYNEADNSVLILLARKTGDWLPVATHFKQVYETTHDSHALLGYCEALSEQMKWDELAQMANVLIMEVDTGDALRFAVQGTYNAKQYTYCIELLDKYGNLFPDGQLPRQLQYLRLDCQHALGILPSAIIDAEKLFREEPSTPHLIRVLSLYYECGDLKKMAIEARLLIDRADVLSEHLLHVAQMIQHEDPELAVSLWKQACLGNVPDNFVGLAVSLSFYLSLENSHEHRALMERMIVLGERGEAGIIMKEIKEFLPLLKDIEKDNVELQQHYQAGKLPVHLISNTLNWSLARLYHSGLEGNASTDDLRRQFPLFARHGGKQLLTGFPATAPKWCLNLDVTAILLAEHLDILRKVEETYAPLRIPADLLPALAQMRSGLLHHQPSRLTAINNILDYVEQNRILAVEASSLPDEVDGQLLKELGPERCILCREAISNHGYVVDFLPLTKLDFSGEQAVLPEEISNRLVNIRALMLILWEEGCFEDDEYTAVLARLGAEGQKEASETVPILGARLYCDIVAELVAEVDLLPLLIKHFQIVLTSSTVSAMRATLRLNKQNQKTIEWLDKLRNRISDGLGKGKYKILSSQPAMQEPEEKDSPTSAVERCLRSLLSFDVTENDVLWVDDRSISAYLHGHGAPIIGINEVLKGLVASGALQEKKYYDKLIALRVANVHFIPLHTDEILHHLKLARVHNGKLTETNALKILRRYTATSLLHGHLLQRPPLTGKAPNSMGEVVYITELSRTIAEVLKTIWADFHQDEAECLARSEWLLSSLYLNLSTTRHLVWTNAEQNDLYLTAMSFSHLLECGFGLSDLDGANSPRQRYYDWLDRRLLKKDCENNPLLAAAIARILKELFKSLHQDISAQFGDEWFEHTIAMALQKYYKPLPEIIQHEMCQDSDFMSRLGLVHLEVVNLGDIIFLASDFYQAASKAINGQSNMAKALEPSLEVAFHAIDGESSHHRFAYVHPRTNRKHVIEDEELAMLSYSPAWREAVLRRNRQWFDCKAVDFEQQVASIASAEEAIWRVERVKEWRTASAADFYQQLDLKIRRQELDSVDDLMPLSLDGLARHLRIPTSVETEHFKDVLEQAASDLVATEGLANAIIRLSGIPVALPTLVIAAAMRLPSEEQRKLVKTLLPQVHSPVGKVHLVYLLLCISDTQPSLARLSRWITIRLLSEIAKPEMEAFSAILLWTNDSFNSQPHFRQLTVSLRLALVWTHAHHLMNLFATSGTPMEWLRETFNRFKNLKILPELFERESKYWYDVAHPYRINMLRLLFVGLSYSFSSHEEYLTDPIKLRTATLVFVNSEGEQMPSIALLQSQSSAHNSLESFLGTDHAEAVEMFWGKDIASIFGHASQHKLILDYLNQSDGDTLSMWKWLGAINVDLPLTDELQRQISVEIAKTDFAQYFKIDPVSASLALRAASLRLRYIVDNPAIHSNLRDQLIKAAHILAHLPMLGNTHSASRNPNEYCEQIYLSLVEVALNIAHANPNNQNVVEEFKILLEQLLLILPALPEVTKPLLQRLYEDTPIAIARQFSHLYVWSRAN